MHRLDSLIQFSASPGRGSTVIISPLQMRDPRMQGSAPFPGHITSEWGRPDLNPGLSYRHNTGTLIYSLGLWPEGQVPSQTPRILAAEPPGAPLGCFPARLTLSGCLLHCPWAAPGVCEWTEGVSLEVSCPADPPEAGAVWHAGRTHRPLYL